jgi:hypothetical protein
MRRTLTSGIEVKRGNAARRKAKKRHVEEVTRLPTKGMATACWAFIVAKRPGRETAPALVLRPLQAANKEIHPQLIHMLLWIACGWISGFRQTR